MRFAQRGLWAILAALWIGALTTPARAQVADGGERRIALIIGIENYAHLTPLKTPLTDARAMADLLEANGFSVTRALNVDRANLLVALADFQIEAAGAQLALIYYAGHGLHLAGADILAPRDAPERCGVVSLRQALKDAVQVKQLLTAIAPARQRIVLLDACRGGAFPSCPGGARGTSGGAGFQLNQRGLGRIGRLNPSGSGLLIGSSTVPGRNAFDVFGNARHSPFAVALLARLKQRPRAPFDQILKAVAGDVIKATGGQQTPDMRAIGVPPNACLAASGCGETAGAGAVPGPVASLVQPPMSSADAAWRELKSSKDLVAYEAFLAQFGKTSPYYAYKARRKLEAMKLAVVRNLQIEQPKELQGDTRSLAYSPDGRQLVSGHGDNTLKLWDAATNSLIRMLEGKRSKYYGVRSVAFSPDGQQLVSGNGGNLAIVFAPTGYNTLQLYDTASGLLIRTLKGHRNYVYSVAYSPDGRLIASGSRDKTLKLWDAASGRLLRTMKEHTSSVTSVAFSPDGRRIVSGGETLKLWEVASGRLIRTMTGHKGGVASVGFSPDGRWIVSVSGKTLEIWDAKTGKELRQYKLFPTSIYRCGSIHQAIFSPDGRRITVGMDAFECLFTVN